MCCISLVLERSKATEYEVRVLKFYKKNHFSTRITKHPCAAAYLFIIRKSKLSWISELSKDKQRRKDAGNSGGDFFLQNFGMRTSDSEALDQSTTNGMQHVFLHNCTFIIIVSLSKLWR